MSDSFDFGNAFEPEKRPRDRDPVPEPTTSAPRTVSVRRTPSELEPGSGSRTRGRRGQAVSWTALILAVASAAVIGAGIFFALNSIHLRVGEGFGEAQSWMLVVAIAICGAILAFALAVAAVVTARPRRVGAAALVVAFTLPLMAGVLGLYFGVTALFQELIDRTDEIRNQALLALTQSVKEDGLSFDAVVELLRLVLSGD